VKHILRRVLAAGRVRELERALAASPTAEAYAELAHEHARRGDLLAALEVAREGAGAHRADERLCRLVERSTALVREERLRELARQLQAAPRDALRAEHCALLLESGRVDRALEAAAEWERHGGGAEARLREAEARLRRYAEGRRRDDARRALAALDAAAAELPLDPRPWRARAELCAKVGAWAEARAAVGRLLELAPGDAALEARHRTLGALAVGSKGLDAALREVELGGRFSDEVVEAVADESDSAALPQLLARAGAEPGVRAACVLRGATALMQGEKGASAERAARGLRDSISASRAFARKLGLGALREVRLDHDDCTTALECGELGSAALRIDGAPAAEHKALLRELARAACAKQVRP
jgi:tetratricopeptide (TPR) repeat protein